MRRTFVGVLLVLGAVLTAAPVGHAAVVNRPQAGTGCAVAPPGKPGETVRQEITSGGVVREYLLHLPENYHRNQPKPLVLSFHGHGGNSEHHEDLTRFSELDAIAVYPQGLLGTDGESAWEGAPYSPDVDDVLFTRDLLDHLRKTVCADTNRIYAAGKSNGGGFVEVLACRMGDRIAAFAPVAGAYYPRREPCTPSRPVPMLSFHGMADPVSPYPGDPAKGLPPIAKWLARWADRDRCDAKPVSQPLGPKLTRQDWQSCDGRGTVAHYRVRGLGHVWPSTKPNEDSPTPTVIDATKTAWRFFLAHPLRA